MRRERLIVACLLAQNALTVCPESGRVCEMRRALLVYHYRGIRHSLQRFADSARVVQVNVSGQDVADLLWLHSQFFQARDKVTN